MAYARERVAPRYEAGDRFGRLDWRVDAELLNISLGGMAVRLETRLEPKTKLQVAIPREAGELSLEGRAKWCRSGNIARIDRTASERSYEAGIGFVGPLDARSDDLVDFISGTPTLGVQRGKFGRFVLDYEQPIRLMLACPFRLRLLSLSGMLVETRIAPGPDSEVDFSIPFDGEDFRARGRVADVARGTGGQPPCRIGIGFDGVSASQRPVLEALVESLRGRA